MYSTETNTNENRILNEYYNNVFNKIVSYQEFQVGSQPDYQSDDPIAVYNERKDLIKPLSSKFYLIL